MSKQCETTKAAARAKDLKEQRQSTDVTTSSVTQLHCAQHAAPFKEEKEHEEKFVTCCQFAGADRREWFLLAQSTDRDHPTPFKSDEIKGELNAQEIEYFYSFTAGPGELTITVDVKSVRWYDRYCL